MHIHELLCFGAYPGAGNPALVIEGCAADPALRQRLARERDTTCVFIDGERIDYFYPHTRSPLCLHATIAVAALLFERRPDAGTIAVTTAMTGQRLELLRAGADYFVRLAAQALPAVDSGTEALARLLRAPGLVPVSPPRTASVGSPKLLVEVADEAALYALDPDLCGIAAWSKEHGVNGIYAWCRRPDGALEGRNFNHLEARLEDSATGVAAGALCAALGRDLLLRQGRATGRDCLIRTRHEGATLLVGGAAARARPHAACYTAAMPNDAPLTPDAFAALRDRFQQQSRKAQAYYTVMHAMRPRLGGDEAADAWMNTPLPAFDGATPAQLVGQGRQDEVLAHIETR